MAFVRPTLLKIVKAHIALKEFGKAIVEAKKHVDNEESVEGLHALGEAQLAAEKFDEALRSYQRAAEIAVSFCDNVSVTFTLYSLFHPRILTDISLGTIIQHSCSRTIESRNAIKSLTRHRWH